MKKATIKFLSIFLAISVLICTLNISVFATDDVDDSIEKVYCEATIDDEFTDNEILIVVTPENNFKEYTVNDFSDIGCIEIEDLTIEPKENELCRIFHLTLSVHSKQNVLDSIKILEERDDIYSAEPNYLIEVEELPIASQMRTVDQTFFDIIDLDKAWSIEPGSDTIKVGVIDTGIDASHPDLVNRVNVQLSKNFVDSSQSATANLVSDHGTHVAGIIGAQGNNSIGVSGVCCDVNLISLRVDSLNEDGTFTYDSSAIASAISYADEIGIDILNFSGGKYGNSLWSQMIYIQIINFDGLFVCSAGNNNINTDNELHYPSSYKLDNLISVGASTFSDTKQINSNYGKMTVDVFAPGECIYSTTFNGNFISASGTSVATPIVTGIAALLLSLHPNLSASELKTIIMTSVDTNNIFEELCVSGGRVNAHKALTSDLLHDYSCINSGDNSTHRYICSECGYAKTENHSIIFNSIDSSIHRYSCSECNYEGQQSHTMHYININNSSVHNYKCSICNYQVQQNHIWRYISVNMRQHKVICTDCSYEYTEAHNFNLLTGTCKICGYNSNNSGTLD